MLVVKASKTVSVPYPGGLTSATVHFSEKVPVEVDIYVDTEPFDSSIDSCNRHIDLLNGNVAETESAQIESVNTNSRKIATSIIGGFFDYIHAEISRQVTELAQQIHACLMHMKELTLACIAGKTQMESDYNRMVNRYTEIFHDLNRELYNRILELDRPALLFKKEFENAERRAGGNSLVSTALITGCENGRLQACIAASHAKKRAFDVLQQSKAFLGQYQMLSNRIQKNILNENREGPEYVPVCFMEAGNGEGRRSGSVFLPAYITAMQEHSVKQGLIEKFGRTPGWKNMSKEHTGHLSLYFQSELDKTYASADRHAGRVKEMIQKIADLSSIQTLNT
jgi:hypothetical protein